MSGVDGPDRDGRGDESCAQLRELAPELTIGLLSGTERAHVLAHLSSCFACQELVERLSGLADRLLLVAPGAEPPEGFETTVLARLRAAQAGGRAPDARLARLGRRARWLAVAFALLALTAAGGALVQHQRDRGGHLDREYVATLRALGGSSLRAARLEPGSSAGPGGEAPAGVAPTGEAPTGEIFVYAGRTSWLFVDVRGALPDGRYRVRVQDIGGRNVIAGSISVSGGSGSWGRTTPPAITRLTGVSVVDPDGTVRLQAQLPTGPG